VVKVYILKLGGQNWKTVEILGNLFYFKKLKYVSDCLPTILFLTPKFSKIVHFVIQAPNFAYVCYLVHIETISVSVKSPLGLVLYCYLNMPTINKTYLILSWPPGSRLFFKMAAKLQEDCLLQTKFAIHILCMCILHIY
jgi:hypothetical protein